MSARVTNLMSSCWVIEDAGLEQVLKLAAYLALVLKPGDAVALNGELGAGKTTFARALIQAIPGHSEEDIPSPTFALVQTYEHGRLPLAHIDCYRMAGADEMPEIGLEDILTRGAALIEWAEKVETELPESRLEIAIADGAREDARTLTLTGRGDWAARAGRLKAMMAFCAGTPWADARPVFLQGDASSRAYARLHLDGETAILMDSPARPDDPSSHDPRAHDGESYSARAHLAQDVRPFVAVANALGEAGVTVPRILAHEMAQGFLICEDLGDRVYAREAGGDPALDELYRAATDVLVALLARVPEEPLPLPDGGAHKLARFSGRVMEFEAGLLLEWFYPAIHGGPCPDDVCADYLAALRGLFPLVEGRDEAWALRDYHSPNLLWRPESEGLARVGVIDFQDALIGHAAYDLVSLLQDARRDISGDLEARMLAHYCEARGVGDSGFDAQAFAAAYAVLGAQRNSKILGIFARLAKRDGKHGYLAHIPRVSAYLERNLGHRALKPLRAWFDAHLPRDARLGPLGI